LECSEEGKRVVCEVEGEYFCGGDVSRCRGFVGLGFAGLLVQMSIIGLCGGRARFIMSSHESMLLVGSGWISILVSDEPSSLIRQLILGPWILVWLGNELLFISG
jgi:hypothetical protein